MEKDFVLVYATVNPFQSGIAKELLDEAQIQYVELNQHDSVIPSIGAIEIYVHETYYETAVDILKNLKN